MWNTLGSAGPSCPTGQFFSICHFWPWGVRSKWQDEIGNVLQLTDGAEPRWVRSGTLLLSCWEPGQSSLSQVREGERQGGSSDRS